MGLGKGLMRSAFAIDDFRPSRYAHSKCHVCAGMDPWVIQPRERTRYQEQFDSLNPINGIVTGEQAKGFLLRSQLQPAILGQIW